MSTTLIAEAHATSASLKNTEKALKRLLKKLRRCCPHEHVIETDYVPQTFLPSLKPRRLCLDCGVEEEGWGAGWQVLTATPIEVIKDRDKFYDRRPYGGRSQEWGWCYGTSERNAHAVPRSKLNSHKRCSEHE